MAHILVLDDRVLRLAASGSDLANHMKINCL
jgi:hypothetical protein